MKFWSALKIGWIKIFGMPKVLIYKPPRAIVKLPEIASIGMMIEKDFGEVYPYAQFFFSVELERGKIENLFEMKKRKKYNEI